MIMASMHDRMRAENLMTQDEVTELRALGWQLEVIQALQHRGFRPCKPDAIMARSGDFDIHRSMGFLRQTAMPHLYVTVERDELPHVVLERIDSAIYEAGYRSGHETLAGHFMRFFEQCKNWKPMPDVRDLEKRLAELEQRAANKEPGTTNKEP